MHKDIEKEIIERKEHLKEHYEMLKSIHKGFYCEWCEGDKKDD
jgi:hypothetical protein